jgi:hypothetical protein
MKKIGGFFELELPIGNTIYHDNAIQLSTGRACLNYILQTIKPTKVLLPYYCCDALFEPMTILGIEYEFYSINNQLEIIELPSLKESELLIFCDFFGIKTNYINDLISIYQEQLIIDNSHSFYQKSYPNNVTFTTARKYFGVPDGAFLYMQNNTTIDSNIKRNTSISINHNIHSLLGLRDLAFSEFSEYEKSLHSKIEKISIVSERLLSLINFKDVRATRNKNFNFFRKELNKLNLLNISDNATDCFCYPLLLKKPISKKELHQDNIFIPTYWVDTVNRENAKDFELECKISLELLPLPIDHRYTEKDLKRVVAKIKEMIE